VKIFNYKKNIKYKIEHINSKDIILHHHLGLGDHITCCGLVNCISETFDHIFLPVFKKNYEIVDYMYKNNKKVNLFQIDSNDEFSEINKFSKKNKLEVLRVGFEKLSIPIQESFYTQLGLSYNVSSDYFNVPYDENMIKKLEEHLFEYYKCKEDYSVLHLEGSNVNFNKTDLKFKNLGDVVYIEKETDIFKNIFYYLDILKNAKEIHCINSSFFCLVERVPTTGKLFFHNLKREHNVKNVTSFYKDWIFVDYD